MGEGSAILVLEREEHARARGAQIFARVTGYGASNDAFHITQPEDERPRRRRGDDARRCATPTRRRPTSATSTPTARRRRSTTASRRSRCAQVFGEDGPPVSSCKARVGHTLGAAGAIEALACVEALRRGALPPTLGLEEIDPECAADHIAGAPREAPDLKVALCNSFAFGGQNATLVLQAA